MRRLPRQAYPAFLCVLGLLCLLVGCHQGGPTVSRVPSIENSGKQFGRALALRESKPLAAAAIFEDMGVIPGMEIIRENLYFDCLKRGHAEPARWREFRFQNFSPELQRKAGLVEAELLIDQEKVDEALALLDQLEDDAPLDIDRLKLKLPAFRSQVGLRMAVRDPDFLHHEAPELEKQLLPKLSLRERLLRIDALRTHKMARQALRELAKLPRGVRRVEGYALLKSRCEQAVGRNRAALASLPGLRSSDAGEARQRAELLRRIAWDRYPGPSARAAFRQCAEAARESLRRKDRVAVLEIELECATESGALDEAWKTWKDLQSRGWTGSRRPWLGRRLGRTLAASSTHSPMTSTMVPGQKRCLRYWEAVYARPMDRGRLEALSRVPISDLYARWARRRLGDEAPQDVEFAQTELPSPEMPESISWLLDRDELDLAAAQWRHLEALRSVSPGEALAAADVEHRRHRPDLVIRHLRLGFQNLGHVEMSSYPRALLRLYLPLRWTESLKTAAREAGIKPWLLAGLARQESVFFATARSPAGALGVVQLMPHTARGHARALGLGSRPDLRDPTVNLRIGARELARLIRRFGALEPALASYNGGENRVRRWMKRWPDVEEMIENIPVPESYAYVRRVMFLSEAYRLVWADAWDEPEEVLSTPTD